MVQRVDFSGVQRSINLWGEERRRRREEEARQRAERAQMIGAVLGGGIGFAVGGPAGGAVGAQLGGAAAGYREGTPGSGQALIQGGFNAASVAQQQQQTEADRELANQYVQTEESNMVPVTRQTGEGPPVIVTPEGQTVNTQDAAQMGALERQQAGESKDARVAALKSALAKTNDPGRTVQLTQALANLFQGRGAATSGGGTPQQFAVWDKDRNQVGVFDDIQSAQSAKASLPGGQGFISKLGTDLPSSQTERWANATPEELSAAGIDVNTLPPNTVPQISSRGQFRYEAAPKAGEGTSEYELVTDPKERESVGASKNDLVQRNKQSKKIEIVRAPSTATEKLPQGYRWTDEKQTALEPIPGGPASGKMPDTQTYQEGNNTVTDFYKDGKIVKTVSSPKWQPGSLARIEEFPIGDDKVKVNRYDNDGNLAESFEVKRFAPGTGDDSMDDLAKKLLKKHINKEKLTQEEMNALKYIGLKGNPVGQVIGSAIGIPGLFRTDTMDLTGGAGTAEAPYTPATVDDAKSLPPGSYWINPVDGELYQVKGEKKKTK